MLWFIEWPNFFRGGNIPYLKIHSIRIRGTTRINKSLFVCAISSYQNRLYRFIICYYYAYYPRHSPPWSPPFLPFPPPPHSPTPPILPRPTPLYPRRFCPVPHHPTSHTQHPHTPPLLPLPPPPHSPTPVGPYSIQ